MMVEWEVAERLLRAFPRSFINYMGEFVADPNSNQYFILKNCNSELDVKCKVLEWLSRAAYKTEPYRTKKKNDELHTFILDGINKFLGTAFTTQDMDTIYTYLGNCCNHDKTIEFIESHYNMSVLEKGRNKMTNIIKCRFLDKDGQPRGNEYSYKTDIPVEVGQLVDVPAPRQSDADSELKTKTVIVSAVDVPESEIAAFADKVKMVVGIHQEEK